jgi:hypothetical protein
MMRLIRVVGRGMVVNQGKGGSRRGSLFAPCSHSMSSQARAPIPCTPSPRLMSSSRGLFAHPSRVAADDMWVAWGEDDQFAAVVGDGGCAHSWLGQESSLLKRWAWRLRGAPRRLNGGSRSPAAWPPSSKVTVGMPSRPCPRHGLAVSDPSLSVFVLVAVSHSACAPCESNELGPDRRLVLKKKTCATQRVTLVPSPRRPKNNTSTAV